ncbi:hypothetical protein NDU88_008862 [Pleurodeles waltl]|uniref:Myb/SANT-like DNA-binding domain-containing protein n=1 Tax=Pleurodeles waltl TaxID=8319 RepID=A0AAV7QVU2_PLEWA|nr:hypothetical protein NDU88_008862 [Pleurodeles waltl]
MGCDVTALALYTVAVGGRRPRRNAALINMGPYGSQEPMTMYAGDDGTHRCGRDRHFVGKYHLAWHVSAHQKKDVWRAIAKDVRTLGVYHRQTTHCQKRWEDIRRWSKKTVETKLGMASQRGTDTRRTMTPLMFRILAVAYPELDGRLRASQQPQGATRPSVAQKLFLSNLGLFPTPPPPRPSHRSRTSTSATTSPRPVVPVVTGIWSAPATRAASVARSHSTNSPPPVKHQKLASARRERGKTPATKAAPRGPVGSVESAVTPSRVGKGHKKPGRSGNSSTAEKTVIIPDAQEATASISPAAQEATASTSPAAQEATASISPAAQEATASISPAAQETTASTSPPGQEATASTSPPGQEATASTSPAGP